MLQDTCCNTDPYTFIYRQNNSVFWDHALVPLQDLTLSWGLTNQNGTCFYQASTCDCLAAQGLEPGWNLTGVPGSVKRQNLSEVLQKVYFFNFLIPMCLRTQLPLGLAWETSFSSACLKQMHRAWQTLVLDVPLELGGSNAGNSAYKTKLSNRER